MADINKSLVALEVLQLPESVRTEEEIREYYDKHVNVSTYLIEDTTVPYVIRIATANKKRVKALNPEQLPEIDSYEISESIQDILRDNGFPVFKHKFPDKDGNMVEAAGKSSGVDIQFNELEAAAVNPLKMIPIDTSVPKKKASTLGEIFDVEIEEE